MVLLVEMVVRGTGDDPGTAMSSTSGLSRAAKASQHCWERRGMVGWDVWLPLK